MNAPKATVALVLLLLGAIASWRLHRPAVPATTRRLAEMPASIDGRRGRDVQITERHYALLETRDVLLREYESAGGAADVLACVAVAGPQHKAAHPPEICYRGQGWHVDAQTRWQVELAGRRRSLEELVISKQGERHLVWSWYRVGSRETPSWWEEQWLALRARIAGDDAPAALLRFSTPIRDGAAAGAGDDLRSARATLVGFLGTFLPAVDAALAAPAPEREARDR